MKDARKCVEPPKKGERQKELESPEHMGVANGTAGGAAGGELARDVGTREDEAAAFEKPTHHVRPRKAVPNDERDHGKPN